MPMSGRSNACMRYGVFCLGTANLGYTNFACAVARVVQRAAMFCSVHTPLVHIFVASACLRPVPEQQLPVTHHVEDFVLGLVRPSCLQRASSRAV